MPSMLSSIAGLAVIASCGGLANSNSGATDGGRDGTSPPRTDSGTRDGRRVDSESVDSPSSNEGACDAASSTSEPPLSCSPGGAGMTNCGASSESCCTSLEVTGGTYSRTYDPAEKDGGVLLAPDGGPAGEADPATVSTFRLDKYVVTVGRFRQFVKAWNGGSGYAPPKGSGKHAHLNCGRGLADSSATPGHFEPGWDPSYDSFISPTKEHLECSRPNFTWTELPGENEILPVDCVNWYEAFAFCIWDGGFLPSEPEWEYAAAGGSEQREYPWGADDPGTDNEYAIYDCHYPSGLEAGRCMGAASFAPVGTARLGAGRWGQLDMAGAVWEWAMDYVTKSYANPCVDCVDLEPVEDDERAVRGGNNNLPAAWMVPPFRWSAQPSSRFDTGGFGFRCARSP